MDEAENHKDDLRKYFTDIFKTTFYMRQYLSDKCNIQDQEIQKYKSKAKLQKPNTSILDVNNAVDNLQQKIYEMIDSKDKK